MKSPATKKLRPTRQTFAKQSIVTVTAPQEVTFCAEARFKRKELALCVHVIITGVGCGLNGPIVEASDDEDDDR